MLWVIDTQTVSPIHSNLTRRCAGFSWCMVFFWRLQFLYFRIGKSENAWFKFSINMQPKIGFSPSPSPNPHPCPVMLLYGIFGYSEILLLSLSLSHQLLIVELPTTIQILHFLCCLQIQRKFFWELGRVGEKKLSLISKMLMQICCEIVGKKFWNWYDNSRNCRKR